MRDAALQLLTAVRKAAGAELLGSALLKELKDGVRKQLTAQSDKLPAEGRPPVPMRTWRFDPRACEAAAGVASCGGQGGGPCGRASAAEKEADAAVVLEELVRQEDTAVCMAE